MEKIININFQGRVIPIEENAYNTLKQYIDSLRSHFANEESSDEIINDIENRIAELLSDRLKRGVNCIAATDVTAVIDSIGRLEDIEAAEGEESKEQAGGGGNRQPDAAPELRGRFYRNADDKVIAGVCSGIALRMGIDPIIVRIIFVLLFGAAFTVYLLLWVIVPSKSINSNITRRLYRNPDDRVIAGVCGGLAAYFRMETWILRLIFALPLLIGIVSRGIYGFWWHSYWGIGPRIFVGSFGSTLSILYIILWIALPYASSASDKLEMRGEKVDINSIKAATQASAGAGATARRSGSGLGRVIGILFKAFFLFIAGIMAISLFGVLIGVVFAGSVAAPFADFLLDDWGQGMLAWGGIVLFLGIPFLALITWIVRRLMGVRSHRHYLGYVFAGLWLIGFISVLTLSGILIRSFSSRSVVEELYPIQQPSGSKLYINAKGDPGLTINHHHHHSRWNDMNWNGSDMPFYMIGNDSLWLNTVKVTVEQSDDSLFHIYETRISRGHSQEEAKNLAAHISFGISQLDSVITLPEGFTISRKDKFRNQQVLVTVEVPLGKHVQFNREINNYNWFNINVEDGRRNVYFERHWNNGHKYHGNSEYIMTTSGLKDPADSNSKDSDEDEEDD